MRQLLLCSIFLSACMGRVDDATAIRVAEANGLHDVKVGDYAMMSCGRGDDYRSHFTATNAEGRRVAGTICCGWMKDCTVRYSASPLRNVGAADAVPSRP